MIEDPKLNRDKNKEHYEKVYANTSINNILVWLKDPERFLKYAIATETSWHGLYKNNFKNRLRGKKIVEMGCGDCVNAAIMASFGAEVFANDIADSSRVLISKLNDAHSFEYPITYVEGDFLKNSLNANSYDFVIGKAFLHHLTIPEEREFLKETARLLKPDGEARFFEPAVNNRLLDELRWHIPVSGRPSKFNKEAFKVWKENDPHPDRSFSSTHFESAGKVFFKKVETLPVGILERFNKLFPIGKFNYRFRRWALRNEKVLPKFLARSGARAQLIVYREPKEI